MTRRTQGPCRSAITIPPKKNSLTPGSAGGFGGYWVRFIRTGRTAGQACDPVIDRTLNALADHLETCLDVDAMLALAGRARHG